MSNLSDTWGANHEEKDITQMNCVQQAKYESPVEFVIRTGQDSFDVLLLFTTSPVPLIELLNFSRVLMPSWD